MKLQSIDGDDMARIVIGDRRYNLGINADGWKTLVKFAWKDIKPLATVPEWLISKWQTDHSLLGYATFRTFTPAQALKVISLAKSAGASPPIHLSINRWGDISVYKIKSLWIN